MCLCVPMIHSVMSAETTLGLSFDFNTVSQSSSSCKGSFCISMGTARDNAGMFLIMPHHFDMIRFIKRWIEEGRATYEDLRGKRCSFGAKRYLRAMENAISRHQLIILTAEAQTPLNIGPFDSLIAVIVMGNRELPVRPLVFASSFWANQISWVSVVKEASRIQTFATKIGSGTTEVPTPQIIVLEPNKYGHRTLSATHGPSTLEPDECWSFRDTLYSTIHDCISID